MEGILFKLAENVLSTLGSYAVQQIGLAWGAKEELRKMENRISTVKNVLLDAQEKQMTNRNVQEWLERLKLVLYDVDDLLDEVATESLRRKVETRNSFMREVRYFFTSSNPILFRHVLGRKIKDVGERLDEIVSQMRDFKFIVKLVESRPIEIKRKEETSSFVCIPEIVGRESDKEDLIRLLLSSGLEANVQIMPIVGMGGLGKTTLAQLVYNDDTIQKRFTKRLWVCVSNDFDIKRILVKLLHELGDNSCTSNDAIEQLQRHVRQMLRDNPFFLVLDDVWTEDRVEWKKLQDLLMTGASGSRIVVTTRSKAVASIVRTNTKEPYELKGLSDDECLDILVRWAFEKGEESRHTDLINIGREIVRKCGGVPLAAMTLGAMLFMKPNKLDWLSVRNNEMWALVQKENDILPILRLSYDQMPSYLKQCFAYCSLFEKDQPIEKRELVYGWMAQGFVHSSDEIKELEDIAEEYIDELTRRSFLQCYGDYYKMHDLVHDLSQYVAGNECLTVTGENIQAIPVTVRHVSFDSSTHSEFPKPLVGAKKLRTIFLPKKGHPNFESSVGEAISGFRCLRLLHHPYTNLDDLDVFYKKIGRLKHLRFLQFCTAETLPDYLFNLVNLQYLNLLCCGLDKLPEDFGKLINLRFLRIISNLTCLSEEGIAGLISLRSLQLISNPELRSLGDGLQHLTWLRELVIDNCPKLASLPAGFRNLTSLEHLRIFHCYNLVISDDDGDLQGLKSLKKLDLLYLPKLESLPKGVLDAGATLTHLHLSSCYNLTTLSESVLPNLESLQVLEIRNCYNILRLPEGMQRLKGLRRLSINGCPLLTQGCEERVGEDWPKIAHVPEILIDRYGLALYNIMSDMIMLNNFPENKRCLGVPESQRIQNVKRERIVQQSELRIE